MKLIKINIKTKKKNYPIIIGSNLIDNFSQLLINNSIKFEKCLLIIDNKAPKNLINKSSEMKELLNKGGKLDFIKSNPLMSTSSTSIPSFLVMC